MTYAVVLNAHASRAFRKLSEEVRARLQPAIDALAANPRPRGAEKLTGAKDTYRLRVGVYRILYEIHDEALLILVVEVAHRREAYRR